MALAKKRKCRQILVWSSMSVQIGGEILKPKKVIVVCFGSKRECSRYVLLSHVLLKSEVGRTVQTKIMEEILIEETIGVS